MGDDPELAQIRARRLAEMQAQGGGASQEQMQKQQEAMQREKEMKNAMLAQILDQGARARLNSIALVKPEKAAMIENMLIQMARSGQIGGKADEDGDTVQSIIDVINGKVTETCQDAKVEMNKNKEDNSSELPKKRQKLEEVLDWIRPSTLNNELEQIFSDASTQTEVRHGFDIATQTCTSTDDRTTNDAQIQFQNVDENLTSSTSSHPQPVAKTLKELQDDVSSIKTILLAILHKLPDKKVTENDTAFTFSEGETKGMFDSLPSWEERQDKQSPTTAAVFSPNFALSTQIRDTQTALRTHSQSLNTSSVSGKPIFVSPTPHNISGPAPHNLPMTTLQQILPKPPPQHNLATMATRLKVPATLDINNLPTMATLPQALPIIGTPPNLHKTNYANKLKESMLPKAEGCPIQYGFIIIKQLFGDEVLRTSSISGKKGYKKLDETLIGQVVQDIKEKFDISDGAMKGILERIHVKLKNYRRTIPVNL